jgi:L-asparaginase
MGCGGTISASARTRGFVVADLLTAAYGIREQLPPDLAVSAWDYDLRSSTEWSLADAFELVEAVAATVEAGDLVGVAITFGTGTLEEVAYLAQLTLTPRVPVVFTASMYPHGHPRSDGAANLLDALLVAASDVPPGVYVVLQGEIHDPGAVAKVHASDMRAFRSLELGPLGRIEDGRPWLLRTPRTTRSLRPAALNARVELVKCYLGMGTAQLRGLFREGTDGLVVESLASGQVPPHLLEPLAALSGDGVAVAISTRCPSGRLRLHESFPVGFAGSEKDLLGMGALPTFEPGTKARIRLLVGLSAGLTGDELAAWLRDGDPRTALGRQEA